MDVPIGNLVLNKRQLIFVETEAKITTVMQLFKNMNILGAPVFDCSKNEFVGMIDIFAIVRFIAIGCMSDKIYGDEEFREISFPKGIVSDIIARDPRSQHYTVLKSSDKLSLALKELTEEKRILVINEENETLRILTQTDIIKYFNNEMGHLSSFMIKINELEPLINNKLDLTGVVSIKNTERALSGFMKMSDYGVTAVAVVDEFGVLVGNLSASDLKGITADTINSIFLPVTKFLNLISEEKPINPVVCSSDDNLADILPKIIKQQVHRVWVVNWEGQPTGIVSLTDLIKILWKSVITSE